MEVKIENMVFGWHEELPEMFIELLNTLVLTKNEQDVRGVMEVFARKELFNVRKSTSTVSMRRSSIRAESIREFSLL